MALKIIEFSEKYPHYNMGAFAYNPPTDTEKLMHSRMSALVFEPVRKRVYQKFCFDSSIFKGLLDLFREEEKVYAFDAIVNDTPVLFKGVRRKDTICAVCMETCERVMFRSTGRRDTLPSEA